MAPTLFGEEVKTKIKEKLLIEAIGLTPQAGHFLGFLFAKKISIN